MAGFRGMVAPPMIQQPNFAPYDSGPNPMAVAGQSIGAGLQEGFKNRMKMEEEDRAYARQQADTLSSQTFQSGLAERQRLGQIELAERKERFDINAEESKRVHDAELLSNRQSGFASAMRGSDLTAYPGLEHLPVEAQGGFMTAQAKRDEPFVPKPFSYKSGPMGKESSGYYGDDGRWVSLGSGTPAPPREPAEIRPILRTEVKPDGSTEQYMADPFNSVEVPNTRTHTGMAPADKQVHVRRERMEGEKKEVDNLLLTLDRIEENRQDEFTGPLDRSLHAAGEFIGIGDDEETAWRSDAGAFDRDWEDLHRRSSRENVALSAPVRLDPSVTGGSMKARIAAVRAQLLDRQSALETALTRMPMTPFAPAGGTVTTKSGKVFKKRKR